MFLGAYWVVSSVLVSVALFLFFLKNNTHVRKIGVCTMEIEEYEVEFDTRVRCVPFLKPELIEEMKVLDDENYYVLREKHALAEDTGEI